MERRGLLYLILLVTIVTFAGAAGMLSFENNVQGSPMHTYGYALWWTSMVMTTTGSDYFPHTAAGRLLCLGLSPGRKSCKNCSTRCARFVPKSHESLRQQRIQRRVDDLSRYDARHKSFPIRNVLRSFRFD